jgi:hypothetical protein
MTKTQKEDRLGKIEWDINRARYIIQNMKANMKLLGKIFLHQDEIEVDKND